MRVISNSGQRYKVVYVPSVDTKSGRISLKVDGMIDLYDEIQSFKDSVDIHALVARYQNGESNVLSQRNGFYGDITGFPKTFAEMHELMVKAQNSFNALPVDVRRNYDFDFGVYLASLGEFKEVPTPAENIVDVEPDEKEVKSE